MPNDIYNQLIDAIRNETSYYNRYDGSSGLTNATYENTQNEYFTSFFDDSFKIEGLYDFYSDVIKEMMSELGMWNRSRYEFELWTQRYNIGTTAHEPHDHFSGCEIISFNHIIDATEKNVFIFKMMMKIKFILANKIVDIFLHGHLGEFMVQIKSQNQM